MQFFSLCMPLFRAYISKHPYQITFITINFQSTLFASKYQLPTVVQSLLGHKFDLWLVKGSLVMWTTALLPMLWHALTHKYFNNVLKIYLMYLMLIDGKHFVIYITLHIILVLWFFKFGLFTTYTVTDRSYTHRTPNTEEKEIVEQKASITLKLLLAHYVKLWKDRQLFYVSEHTVD